jgi:uncharacterized protein (TIGR03435 family)
MVNTATSLGGNDAGHAEISEISSNGSIAMAYELWRRIGFVVLALATNLPAQQPTAPAAPRFDLVSIRVVPPNADLVMRDQNFTPILPGGRYIDSRTALVSMIAFAYNVRNPDIQLVGLPNWAKKQVYAVAAKPADSFPSLPRHENEEQVRLMMRAMLADRFHLQLHTENRRAPVLNLVIAKGGIKIKAVSPPVPPEKEGHVNAAVGDRSGRMIATKATMAGLASALTLFLKEPVIDETGLKNYYDFDFYWTAPEVPGGKSHEPGLGTEGLGLLISNLQEQFGLRLVKSIGPVEFWIVDHLEQPTGN